MGSDGEFDIDPNLDGGGEFHIGDDGSFQKCAECCGCPDECPCSAQEWSDLVNSGTSCGGLVKCYELKDYTDYDLSACDTCEDVADTAWDGSVIAWDLNVRCMWNNEDPSCGWSISGKRFHNARINHFPLSDCWLLEIYCCDKSSPPMHPTALVWKGNKSSGPTPVGTYSRTTGCDSTSSLEVVEKSC